MVLKVRLTIEIENEIPIVSENNLEDILDERVMIELVTKFPDDPIEHLAIGALVLAYRDVITSDSEEMFVRTILPFYRPILEKVKEDMLDSKGIGIFSKLRNLKGRQRKWQKTQQKMKVQ